jgi:hypothetical protein
MLLDLDCLFHDKNDSCVYGVQQKYINKGWNVKVELIEIQKRYCPIFIFCDVTIEKKWSWKKLRKEWVVK